MPEQDLERGARPSASDESAPRVQAPCTATEASTRANFSGSPLDSSAEPPTTTKPPVPMTPFLLGTLTLATLALGGAFGALVTARSERRRREGALDDAVAELLAQFEQRFAPPQGDGAFDDAPVSIAEQLARIESSIEGLGPAHPGMVVDGGSGASDVSQAAEDVEPDGESSEESEEGFDPAEFAGLDLSSGDDEAEAPTDADATGPEDPIEADDTPAVDLDDPEMAALLADLDFGDDGDDPEVAASEVDTAEGAVGEDDFSAELEALAGLGDPEEPLVQAGAEHPEGEVDLPEAALEEHEVGAELASTEQEQDQPTLDAPELDVAALGFDEGDGAHEESDAEAEPLSDASDLGGLDPEELPISSDASDEDEAATDGDTDEFSDSSPEDGAGFELEDSDSDEQATESHTAAEAGADDSDPAPEFLSDVDLDGLETVADALLDAEAQSDHDHATGPDDACVEADEHELAARAIDHDEAEQLTLHADDGLGESDDPAGADDPIATEGPTTRSELSDQLAAARPDVAHTDGRDTTPDTAGATNENGQDQEVPDDEALIAAALGEEVEEALAALDAMSIGEVDEANTPIDQVESLGDREDLLADLAAFADVDADDELASQPEVEADPEDQPVLAARPVPEPHVAPPEVDDETAAFMAGAPLSAEPETPPCDHDITSTTEESGTETLEDAPSALPTRSTRRAGEQGMARVGVLTRELQRRDLGRDERAALLGELEEALRRFNR